MNTSLLSPCSTPRHLSDTEDPPLAVKRAKSILEIPRLTTSHTKLTKHTQMSSITITQPTHTPLPPPAPTPRPPPPSAVLLPPSLPPKPIPAAESEDPTGHATRAPGTTPTDTHLGAGTEVRPRTTTRRRTSWPVRSSR